MFIDEIVKKSFRMDELVPSMTVAGFDNIEITSDTLLQTEAALYGIDGELGVKLFDCIELFAGGSFKIEVFVNDSGKNFNQANPNNNATAPVDTVGDVTITP